MPLWKIEDLSEEALSNNEKSENIYVGFINNEPVIAMILKWYDPVFRPDIKENDSGFIYKLSIKRKYASQGYSKKMIQFAESECKRRGIKYLRLDCAGDRDKLKMFYESQGFRLVERKYHKGFDVAFYEKNLVVPVT